MKLWICQFVGTASYELRLKLGKCMWTYPADYVSEAMCHPVAPPHHCWSTSSSFLSTSNKLEGLGPQVKAQDTDMCSTNALLVEVEAMAMAMRGAIQGSQLSCNMLHWRQGNLLLIVAFFLGAIISGMLHLKEQDLFALAQKLLPSIMSEPDVHLQMISYHHLEGSHADYHGELQLQGVVHSQ